LILLQDAKLAGSIPVLDFGIVAAAGSSCLYGVRNLVETNLFNRNTSKLKSALKYCTIRRKQSGDKKETVEGPLQRRLSRRTISKDEDYG